MSSAFPSPEAGPAALLACVARSPIPPIAGELGCTRSQVFGALRRADGARVADVAGGYAGAGGGVVLRWAAGGCGGSEG